MFNALIVGGTSGLGIELAKLLSKDYEVYVTGRENPSQQKNFIPLDLRASDLPERLDNFMTKIPGINLYIHAAGYFQEGKIDDLTDVDILNMNSVGLVSPQLLIKRLIQDQQALDGFIAITSTSQVTPREREPVYTGVKSGLAMFARSISLDHRIGRVLVAAPAGMKTNFWRDSPKDTSTFLEPNWVADQIIQNYEEGDYRYSEIQILRDPARVEQKEKR